MKNYLFDMPSKEKLYAKGLSPEIDKWAKESEIQTHYSPDEEEHYSAFIGDIDLVAEYWVFLEDYGLITFGRSKAEVVERLYFNIKQSSKTVAEWLKYIREDEE